MSFSSLALRPGILQTFCLLAQLSWSMHLWCVQLSFHFVVYNSAFIVHAPSCEGQCQFCFFLLYPRDFPERTKLPPSVAGFSCGLSECRTRLLSKNKNNNQKQTTRTYYRTCVKLVWVLSLCLFPVIWTSIEYIYAAPDVWNSWYPLPDAADEIKQLRQSVTDAAPPAASKVDERETWN